VAAVVVKYAEMVDMDPELAREGRCWRCKIGFERDLYYFRLSMDTATQPSWLTCVGCTAALLCPPRS
jgi:hypothetical protein